MESSRKSWNERFVEAVFVRSWWVFAFFLLSYVLFDQSIKRREFERLELDNRFCSLEKQRNLLLKEKDDLQMKITSQSDPAWIEMVLMKELGVVPEGYLKVHFKKDSG